MTWIRHLQISIYYCQKQEIYWFNHHCKVFCASTCIPSWLWIVPEFRSFTSINILVLVTCFPSLTGNGQFHFKNAIFHEFVTKIPGKSCLAHCGSTTRSRKTYFSSKSTTAKARVLFCRFDIWGTETVNTIWPGHRLQFSMPLHTQHKSKDTDFWLTAVKTQREFFWQQKKSQAFQV